MKKRKNAFTLIELLAILVILAIIAVITVPIILNIIENSRMGAAQDSAYGYKDAVNKYYITELSKPENQSLLLNGQYNVLTGGVLTGSGITNKEIPVSGDKPSAGELHYSNNELKGGCLVIGDYAVIFEGGNATSTTKGDCSDYVYTGNIPSMDEMCPGCVFAINQLDIERLQGVDVPDNYTSDYTELNSDVFFGYILDESTHIIQRTFGCVIYNNTPICIESTKSSSKTLENVAFFNDVFQISDPRDDSFEYVYNEYDLYIILYENGLIMLSAPSLETGFLQIAPYIGSSDPIESGWWSS